MLTRSCYLYSYCECFAAGLYCIEPCSCLDCFNNPGHEGTVLETWGQIESRNPLAFAPKVIRNLDSASEFRVRNSPKLYCYFGLWIALASQHPHSLLYFVWVWSHLWGKKPQWWPSQKLMKRIVCWRLWCHYKWSKCILPLAVCNFLELRVINFCSCRRLTKLQLQPGIKEDATVKNQVA